MDIKNLEAKVQAQLSLGRIKMINQLKFQNSKYCVGNNIKLRCDMKSNSLIFGKIISILSCPFITQFPLLQVCWYQHIQTSCIPCMQTQQLSKKQLVLSDVKDYQYIEAVRGKIQVLTEEEFINKDSKQQEMDGVYFCRAYIDNKRLRMDSKRYCFCQQYYKPEAPIIMCQICKVMFHPACVGRDDRCIKCIY